MKCIELTEERKSTLLEMCKVLFSEYKYYGWSELYDGSKSDLIGIMFYKEDGTVINIHWFEFCMTHLINALAWENIKTDILADCEYEDARLKYLLELAKDRSDPGQYHPIDYLYEEFKKLKI